MKKLIFALFLLVSITFVQNVNAQSGYKNAAGLFIDVGNGGTFVGPSIKHYFNPKDALQGMIIFGNGATVLGAEYSYNAPIRNANGLMWNIGIGPQVLLADHYSDFIVRPSLGLEYKIPGAPLDFGFDWRPWWTVTHGSHFEAGRFGLGLRFVIN
ncbi:hypothetical protein [Arachidicoccus sp.]|uniref:hypothetical protein n=1 Tax=Arachidicoccus sp. TaxID=1872624 RepID=UPI003D1C3E9F